MQTQEVPHSASVVPIEHLSGDPLYTRLLGVLRAIWRAMTMNRRVATGCTIVGRRGGYFQPVDLRYANKRLLGSGHRTACNGTLDIGRPGWRLL